MEKPRVCIVQEDEDANIVLSGILCLKGLEAHKFTKAEDCIKKIKELKGKIDVVVLSGDIASDRYLMIVLNVKQINNNIKILVIAEEDSEKTRVLGYGADEFTLKPMSPENVVDKVLMLISREAVLDNR